MTDLPQAPIPRRAARMRLSDVTPAVLRFQDGHRSSGNLQIISLTGGLLNVSDPLDQGAFVKLMFLTHTGPVLGAAELLRPVSRHSQPFRFVALQQSDQRRLQAAIESSLGRSPADQEWIDKYRTTLSHRKPPRAKLLTVVLGAFTLGTLCLASVFYYLHMYRPR